jgi:hypothetical protein
MIKVMSASGSAEAVVSIGVTGTPPLKATFQERQLQPERITVRYRYQAQVDTDGWTHHVWTRVNVVVDGPRILKPAADGSQRLGVEVLRYNPVFEDLPEWLVKLADEFRPSGDIALVSV